MTSKTGRRGSLRQSLILRSASRLSAVTEPLVKQLVRSGTSIGANYAEADDAESKKGFRYRIGICKRESRETKYWLRMIAHAAPATREEARTHWLEAKELHLIFASIYRGKSKGTTKHQIRMTNEAPNPND